MAEEADPASEAPEAAGATELAGSGGTVEADRAVDAGPPPKTTRRAAISAAVLAVTIARPMIRACFMARVTFRMMIAFPGRHSRDAVVATSPPRQGFTCGSVILGRSSCQVAQHGLPLLRPAGQRPR
jgi:hypothetical protein